MATILVLVATYEPGVIQAVIFACVGTTITNGAAGAVVSITRALLPPRLVVHVRAGSVSVASVLGAEVAFIVAPVGRASDVVFT